MGSADKWIDQFLKRVRIGEFLRRAAEFGAVFLFSFGTIVLVVKLLIPQLWPHVLWIALCAVPTAVAAWWYARRSWCSRDDSVALLDEALGTGGLLMTLTERPDPFWRDRLPKLDLQYRQALPKYRPTRFASYLALPLMFAVAACFVPLREASTAPVLKNTAARNATEQLEELLAELEATTVLEEAEEEKLKEEIQRLVEETEQSPLTSEKWETLDALRERMQTRLTSAEINMSKATEAAEELRRAELSGEKLTLERKLLLEKQLADALSKLSKNGNFANAPQGMQDDLQKLMKNGKLKLAKGGAARQQQLEQLRKFLEEEQDKLKEIRKNCKACQNGQCPNGQCEGGQCQGGMCQGPGQQGSANSNNGRPGSGGVNRGRGDAAMSWGDESDQQGVKFKESVLPQGFREQAKDEIDSIKASAPDVDPAAAAPRSAAHDSAASAGSTTVQRRLSPKHRAAVRKYFDTSKP
ncbi:hypothetical protein [Symmachiella dynata]|uniref:hypothetical protein n=1 Tax=Symmachiella dynata TaxID=2527995 RepID=UPI0030EE5373